jgi:DNA invertase Pin-like site-specific DNA recombinase
MVVGIMAVIAQNEREMIARRTREALAIARQRLAKDGLRLGNPNGAKALRKARKGNSAAVSVIVQAADKRAEDLRDVLKDVQANGHLSFLAIAEELNRREIETPSAVVLAVLLPTILLCAFPALAQGRAPPRSLMATH